jgi:hypothetical protein
MRYNGPYIAEEIGRFIVEVARSVQLQENSVKELIKEDSKGSIPAYTIGHPLCGPDDNVCYLDFDDAYGKDNVGPERSKQQHILHRNSGMGLSGRGSEQFGGR